MKLSFVILFVFILTAPNLHSETTETSPGLITLSQAIRLAMRRDIELRKLNYDQRIYQAKSDEAMRDFFPKISSEIKRSPAITFANPRGTTIFSLENNVDLPIYNRALLYNKRKTRSETLLNQYRIEKRLNDLSKEITTLYYSVLNLKAIVQIREDEYEKSTKLFRLTKKKLKHNKVLPLDVLLSKGHMEQNKVNLLSANNDYLEEKLKLAEELQLDKDYELEDFEGDVLTVSADLEDNISKGLLKRSEIRVKSYELKVSQELYEIERSVFYPQVSLLGNLTLSSEDSYSLTDRKDWSVYVMLSLALMDDVTLSVGGGLIKDYRLDSSKDQQSAKISLFDGSSRKVERYTVQSLMKTAEDELRKLKYTIRRDITVAYHNYMEAKARVELASLNKQIGSGLVRKAIAENKIGKKGFEDVIEARQKEILYRIEDQQARLRLRLTILDLKWSVGILWKSDI